ncbi:MAG TPA: tetratricopeptide repeat protein, partial [Alcanivorax sp.]|nr:tetratricopeptide repeat protein [Alcanivorax sp.]
MSVNKTARRPQRPRPARGRSERHATAKDAFARAYNGKHFAEAERHARALTEQWPDDAFAWQALGAARFEKHSPNAISALYRSLQLEPGNAQTLLIMGKAQMAAKDWQAAAQHLRACLASDPNNAFAHLHLARTLRALGDGEAAVKHIDQAHHLAPENTTILASRINIYASARKVGTVLEDCKRLLELDDSNASFFNLAAIKHSDVGLFEEAENYYSRALECDPSHLIAFSNRIFNAHYNPAHDNAAISDLIRRWRTVFSPSERPARPHPVDLDGGRKLTVGLLSAGLRTHPVGQMITTALENLPADQFELVAYSSSDAQDHVTRRLRRITPRWRFITDLDDDALAQRIRDDQVDILIDLSGHTDGNRLTMIAMEPAPLIVKWVGGLVNTTGLDAIDYLISDSVETPPGCDPDYYEKLIRLPDDYICYLPPGHAPDVKALPALSAGYITFGCLNNPAKINPVLIREWSRLLREVDDSRLLLKGAQYLDDGFCERIWARFEDAGIDRARVILEGPEK